ncbi:pirin family protein [Microaceticoccus formicicus]|uniref:pirin family protein n=1 Tax=Microaceticoccus formicicus TaxID=3118105 RepID=UPI003CD04DC2|nr:pirin family protein [Peptoniphilaceae bacterium AMB_02]
MSFRAIEKVFRNNHAHWVGDGFRVKQYFPLNQPETFYQRFSPFILLDYNEPFFFRATPFEVGVGPHPHRGFETVTFAFAGKVEHGDNLGNSGVIEPGDIQWMTAGGGILHKEYHEKEFSKKDRILHMIQLWVNLPRKDKMTNPKYQAITADQMGKYFSEDERFKLIVYAGEVNGINGPASTFSPMNIYKVDIAKGRTETFLEPADYNTGLLVLAGEVKINGDSSAKATDFVLFENDGKPFNITGVEEHSEVFILSGQPLNEPVVQSGPFVMSTREELRQAAHDFKSGKFGSLDF